MEGLLPIIIQALGGAAGGGILGNLIKGVSMGGAGNSIVGALGGALGGKILPVLLGLAAAKGGGGFDIGSLITQFLSGGASGGVATVLIGLLRSMMSGSR